jgi:hypothetical protein
MYLDTGYVPNAKHSMIARFSDTNNTARCVVGVNGGANRFLFLYGSDSADECYYGNGGVTVKAPAITNGVLAVAGDLCYRNGADEGVTTSNWQDTNTYSIWIGRRNGSTPAHYFNGKIQAVAIYDTTLSAAQVLAITNAMTAL